MEGIPGPGLQTGDSCHPRTCYYVRLNHRMRWVLLGCTSGLGKRPTGRCFLTIILIDFAPRIEPTGTPNRGDNHP
jgi:hypothetical protein